MGAQDRQRNTAARSINNCSCGKQLVLHILSVCLHSCLSYPACKAHAPYYIAICGLSGTKIYFFHISQTPDFGKNKITECKRFVLIFSTILSETLLILRITERDMIINEHWFSCKIPVTGVSF